MSSRSTHILRRAALGLAALMMPIFSAPGLQAQTTATCNGLPATIVATTPGQIIGTQGDDVIVGTAGDDQILGLGGNDTICGRGGNDQITGGQGVDTLFGEAGNDTFLWSPGDGNDRIEGATEIDTLQVVSSSVGETIDLSANGNRLRFFRNVASIVLDVAGVERVNFEARGGADLLVVNPLAGTGVQHVTFELQGAPNANTPDGQSDAIIVFGSAGDDQISISGSGNAVTVTGAGPIIEIRNPEGALDTLSVQSGAGQDRVNAEGLAAGLVSLTVEGGPGKDTITGSRGADKLVGGDDDDILVWTAGSPADLLSGEAGVDTLHVLGSTAPDNWILSASLSGVQMFNVPDSVSFEAAVERVMLLPGRGADQMVINTLAGSALQQITVDLRPVASGTAGDGLADSVTISGTTADDTINITGSAGSVNVAGLPTNVAVQGSDGVRDTVSVTAGSGADSINAQGLAAGVVRLALRGSLGVDNITGSPGDDLFLWLPGDSSDVIEAGLGNDTLQFDGANVTENLGLMANGSRLRFTRDVASVVLDVNGVERVILTPSGAGDTISFGDLSSTNVREIAINLGGPGNPGGDGQADTIQITSLTTGPISTAIAPGMMTITWSPVRITVTGLEPANDRLVLQTPAGAPPPVSSVVAPGVAIAAVSDVR